MTVKDLLLSDDEAVIEDIMDTNVIFCRTTDERVEAAELISDYDLLAIPVVDKEGRLVGIVTVDDVIDVLQEEATEDFDRMPVSRLRISRIRARASWRCGSAAYPG